jgi:iron complex outermembrane receptor protein
VDKDFGAAGFYGPAPSHERTQQTLLHARHSAPLAPGWELETQAGFRRHGDRFVYDARRTALFAARHLTHALNAAAKLHWRSASGHRLSLGAEGGRDWIDSSSLGDHADARAAGFVELQRPLARRAQLHAGLRLDGYERYGSAWSPSLAAVGWLSSDLRLQASLGRSFRVPTYTELFYADPNHEASNSLGPESAWSGDLGADWGGRRGLGAGLTAFARGERNVVDWVRSTPQERWRTANIHRIRAAGLEAWLAWSRPTWKLEAGWAFTSVDSDEQDRLTKYVSDYARHSLRLRATAEPGSWLLGERTVFKRYADGRAFCLVDLRVARALGRFRPYLELTNLLDADWQEIRGVEQPGRGVELGLQFRK